MARCRIGYLLALAAAVLFYICYNGYLALCFLALALSAPIFSLLVSLPGILGLRAELSVPFSQVRRGDSAGARLKLRPGCRLPLARVKATFRCTNRLTGAVFCRRRRTPVGGGGLVLTEEFSAPHCGCCRWEITHLRVCDYLGLFSFRPAIPPAREVLVLPTELPPEPVPALLGQGEKTPPMKIRPGGGPGEDYDLRPYRPGDPLRSVHWKLSAKTGDLVVRETLEPVKTTLVLTLDLFGSPEKLDRTFDRLDAVSRALIEAEKPHLVRWADPVTGELCTRSITCPKDLRACEWAALTTPAPETGHSITALPQPLPGQAERVRSLHLSEAPAPPSGGEGV